MGEMEEFSVPQKPDDLLDAKGSYYVEEIEFSDALQALDGANGPCAPECCFMQRRWLFANDGVMHSQVLWTSSVIMQ